MSKAKEGLVKVLLKTGLRRGPKAHVAGELVEVEAGLAARLIENGQADKPKAKAKPKAAQTIAPTPDPKEPTPDPAEPGEGDGAT